MKYIPGIVEREEWLCRPQTQVYKIALTSPDFNWKTVTRWRTGKGKHYPTKTAAINAAIVAERNK